MKVALKYCGGCDPQYERVEYWEKIRDAAGEDIKWVTLNGRGYRAALFMCGCATACPLKEIPLAVPVVAVKHDGAEPAAVVKKILQTIPLENPDGKPG